MELDLGIDFSVAEAEAEEAMKAVAPGDYTLQVVKVEVKTGKNSGRPYLNWQLKVINNPESNGKIIFHFTPLPWTNPSTNQFETSGIGFLVDITKALGRSWNGGKMETNDYVGATCPARVKNTLNDGKPRAEIETFLS